LAALAFPIVIVLQARHINVMSVINVAGPFLGVLAGLGVSAVALNLEKRPFSSIGFVVGRRWFLELGIGVTIGALLLGISALLLRALGGFTWRINPAGNLRDIGIGFICFSAVGMSEEITFRGYPFQRLLECIGTWPAQLFLALLFAILHLGNPGISTANPTLKAVSFFNIALSAILLGFCYLRTRSLAVPIGLHIGWNWAQGNLLGFGVSGTTLAKGFWIPVLQSKPQWMTGGEVGIEGSLICTLVTGLAVLVMVWWEPTPTLGPNCHQNVGPERT